VKRAHAAEQRTVLSHFCQLEGDALAEVVKQDLNEFETQISTRLLADQEYQLCEERKKLVGQVSEEVELHLATYRRQMEDEEQAIVRERRKWLTDRLVLLQAQGSVGPSDRALLQRLRQEMRACESKIELHDNEFVKAPTPTPSTSRSKDVPGGRLPRPFSASKRPFSRPNSAGRRSPAPGCQEHHTQPSATGQNSEPSSPASASGASKHHHCQHQQHRSPMSSPPESPRLPLPQFGGARDGVSPEFGLKPPQQPLYEWPFDSPLAQPPSPRLALPGAPRSCSVPVAPRLKPLDVLAPLKGPAHRPAPAYGAIAETMLVDVGAPRLSLKPPTPRNRSVPPLPPVRAPYSAR